MTMYAFVWEAASSLNEREHNYGGFLAVAASLERAREMIAAPFCTSFHFSDRTDHDDCEMSQCREKSDAMTKAPDSTYELTGCPDESLVVFPDSGCC